MSEDSLVIDGYASLLRGYYTWLVFLVEDIILADDDCLSSSELKLEEELIQTYLNL